jgi:hypothetical protein
MGLHSPQLSRFILYVDLLSVWFTKLSSRFTYEYNLNLLKLLVYEIFVH